MFLHNKNILEVAGNYADTILLDERKYMIRIFEEIEKYVSHYDIVIGNREVNPERVNLYYELYSPNAKEHASAIAKLCIDTDPIKMRYICVIERIENMDFYIVVDNIRIVSIINGNVESKKHKAQFTNVSIKYINQKMEDIKTFFKLINLDMIDQWPETPTTKIDGISSTIKTTSLIEDIFNIYVKERLLSGEVAAIWYRDNVIDMTKKITVITREDITAEIRDLDEIAQKYKTAMIFNVIDNYTPFDVRIKKLSVSIGGVVIMDIYDLARYYPILYNKTGEFCIAYPFAVMLLALMDNSEAYNMMINIEKNIPIDDYYGYFEDYESSVKKMLRLKNMNNNRKYFI